MIRKDDVFLEFHALTLLTNLLKVYMNQNLFDDKAHNTRMIIYFTFYDNFSNTLFLFDESVNITFEKRYNGKYVL